MQVAHSLQLSLSLLAHDLAPIACDRWRTSARRASHSWVGPDPAASLSSLHNKPCEIRWLFSGLDFCNYEFGSVVSKRRVICAVTRSGGDPIGAPVTLPTAANRWLCDMFKDQRYAFISALERVTQSLCARKLLSHELCPVAHIAATRKTLIGTRSPQ